MLDKELQNSLKEDNIVEEELEEVIDTEDNLFNEQVEEKVSLKDRIKAKLQKEKQVNKVEEVSEDSKVSEAIDLVKEDDNLVKESDKDSVESESHDADLVKEDDNLVKESDKDSVESEGNDVDLIKDEIEETDSLEEVKPKKTFKDRLKRFKEILDTKIFVSDYDLSNDERLKRAKIYRIFYTIITAPIKFVLFIVDLVVTCLKFTINIGVLCCLIGAIFGVFVLAQIYPKYQEAREVAYEKLASVTEDDFQLLSNTTVYYNNGKPIGTIDSNKYVYVDIADISLDLQNAYIAVEDKNFKNHIGIDMQGLIRASVSLVKNSGEITQGGSTITQQVVKNVMLSQDQTYARKLTEILIAPSLEKKYSKDKIMEYYCNTCYYGNQCYGVESASEFYLDKHAKDLTIAESAMIAGISNSPNNYNPVDNMELCLERRNIVLEAMLKQEYITQEEYDKAVGEEIKLADLSKKTNTSGEETNNYLVSYAIHCTVIELMKKDGFEFKYTYKDMDEYNAYKEAYTEAYKIKSAQVRAGGYHIYTSFNKKIQKTLQETIDNDLSYYTTKQDNGKYDLQGAAVCIDNDTNMVIAMVGGRGTEDSYNRAFLSTRQPGSTIKPLLDYGPAIDNGVVSASSIVRDEEILGTYSPHNSGGKYSGDVTVREALARSINTVAYKLFSEVGNDVALGYLDSMHFTSLSMIDNDAQSISLGGFTNGLTVVDMAKGYNTLENHGKYNTKTCLKKVEFEKEGVVYDVESDNIENQVYNEDTAFIMCDIMQGTFNESYGTGHSAYNRNQIYAGKTGTTSDNKDAWFCGFSKYYTTAVWIGCDTPKTMSGMYGGTKPLQIWKDFMNTIHVEKEKADFEKPDTIVLAKFRNNKFQDIKKEDNDSDEEIDDSDGENEEDITLGSNSYYNERKKKKGYEWYSEYLATIGEAFMKENASKTAYQEATEAVKNFEKYVVNTLDEALGLDDAYKQVVDLISNCTDYYDMEPYRKRARDRYELLSKTVVEDWAETIAEYNQGVAEEQALSNKLAADDSKTSALARLKEVRVNKAEWFINKLNSRSYYNDITKLIIKDGSNAIARIKGYSEYDNMKDRWDSAVSRAKDLPDNPETPKQEEDKEDNKNIDYNDYEDIITEETTTESTEMDIPDMNLPTQP